jgi:hypothetical protein
MILFLHAHPNFTNGPQYCGSSELGQASDRRHSHTPFPVSIRVASRGFRARRNISSEAVRIGNETSCVLVFARIRAAQDCSRRAHVIWAGLIGGAASSLGRAGGNAYTARQHVQCRVDKPQI